FGARFDELPSWAIGVYTYFKRLSQGLRQMMAGERKFTLEYVTRDDIASLTKEASDISGIPFITDIDKDEVQKILKAK
ncbi:MAG: glutamate synthase-like protein, partial [Candidatus Aminicenantes bacterium]|nr:glutamate synthase-like protein [Candidatus Aminicenantes bacterium]